MRATRLRDTLSLAGEGAIERAELDVRRRLALLGMAGAAFAMSSRSLRAETLPPDRTTVSKEGLIRTVLERYENDAGEEFNLILDTFPAGIVIPVHHHPSVGLNYVLDGVAETQYEGEELRRVTSGDTFQDHASRKHLVFRNPDKAAPVRILITYMVKKGQPFLIVP